MFKEMKKRIKNEKGLTLIELLAVIVILAIIAAIAIPAIGSMIENSKIKAMKSDAVNIISAANLYYSDGNVDIFNDENELAVEYVGDSGQFTDYSVSSNLLFTGEAENGTATVSITAATVKEIDANSANGNAKVTTSKDATKAD